MTIGEGAGKVAEALKGSPGLLAVLIVSCVWAALTYLGTQNSAIRQHEERIALYERCFPLINPDGDGR